jgi:hypothetical protein
MYTQKLIDALRFFRYAQTDDQNDGSEPFDNAQGER